MVAAGGEVSGQAAIRRQNLSRILTEVHVRGAVSRSDLAAHLGVNRSTVGSLVAELAARGLVRERRPAENPMPGRPSPLVEPRTDGLVVLAIEIATDSLAVAVVGLGGAILGSTRVGRQREWRAPARIVADVAELAEPFLADRRKTQTIFAVGVSIPGVVRHEDGFVHVAPNVGWRDIPLAALIRQELRLDVPVVVGNDAELAALAEHTRGAGVGRSDFICLWGEAGMGAGVVTGGQPLRGSAGYAGEAGHMAINPDGRACSCGSRGCWETEVGEEALVRHAGQRIAPGGRTGLDELFQAADRGMPDAIWAIETVGHWLGIGIAALVNIFNPSAVALGGLYARLYPYVRRIVERELDERAMSAPRRLVTIVPASLGPDSALLGAAERALAPTLHDPTSVCIGQGADSAA